MDAVRPSHRPGRGAGEPSQAPADVASPKGDVPERPGDGRPGRLTKQVVFLMLIGWLVLVILVVVLVSAI